MIADSTLRSHRLEALFELQRAAPIWINAKPRRPARWCWPRAEGPDGPRKVILSDIILFAHPTFGVLGILAAVWVFVEALNASEDNQKRIWYASLVVTVCIVAAWILGGFWYVNYYYAEKAVILKGPWPWAHNIFMETKEHLFFIPLILALYLPIAAAQKLAANPTARAMVMVVTMFVVLNGLVIEGAGAIINYGAKVAFIHSGAKGSE